MEVAHLDADHIPRVIAHLALEARYHIFAWEPPLVGRDAIAEELLSQAERYRDLTIEIVTIGSVGSTVFMERLDSMTLLGVPVTLHVAGVMEIDDAGKVRVWRDYLDHKEVETKLSEAAGNTAEAH